MRTRFLKVSLLCAFFAAGVFVTGCSDDNGYSDVDGESPVAVLKTNHIQSGAGHDFTIEGTLTDADGISAIKLECADLYLNKTIDLIEIYGEPKTSYDLSYKFSISKDEVGEQFTVKVTVVDVGGRETSQDVLITMDGDFEAPKFTVVPSATVAALLKEGQTTIYSLNITATDDRALDYVLINIKDIEGYSPLKVDAEGKTEIKIAKEIEFPYQEKDYEMSFTVVDKVGNEVTSNSILSIAGLKDFEKLYLADVETVEELNSDVFGVPMLIEHTGEFQYEARYYNKAAGTKIYFLSQKNDFSPICFGLDLSDNTVLTYETKKENVNPIILDQPNVYYKIIFNTKTGDYTSSTYSVVEATDPINYEYGKPCFDLWENGTEFINFYIGWGGSPQDAGNHLFAQDSNNPHLFYYPSEGTWTLSSGEEMNFIISNYHPEGWWDHVEWRCDNSTEIEKFGYFSKKNDVNPNCEGTNQKWADGSSVQDNWMKPVVTNGGNYRFEFDAHLGRGKIVPVN